MSSNETRIEALEMRIAHQDRAIEDLNTTVTDLWKQIEAVSKQVARMGDRLQRVEENAPTPGDERPPHY